MAFARRSHQAFVGGAALLFAAAAAATIAQCASMQAMGGMPMPGGWTMSMTWMRMSGQSWPGVAAAFLAMWVAMMVAMMLPSLMPMLWRYRQVVVGRSRARLGWLTVLAGAGYFCVWTVWGVAVFPLGAALAAATMRWPVLARAVPMAAGVVVLLAGALQFGAWKIRWLACCRAAPGRGRGMPANAVTAWRHGVLLGLHCSYCCVGLTATWLVIGVMDLRAMAAVAAATTFERLAADSPRAARFVGLLMLATGMALVAHAARPG